MRIRKIIFNNVNNLKGGPHVISFEEEPLNSAGIFAITGPTGSGKSTILDVITLALFNRIPRYDGKISDKKMQELGSVITHHATEADATVEYEVNGNRFTSKWSVHLAKNSGKIQPYDMSIHDASGNYLDLKRSDVPSKNEEIIGLDYEQFVKSIILSQGEFSKFLKSSVNERSKLLEKLTGGAVYRKLSQAAYRKNKDIEQKLKFEKSVFSEIDLFTPEKTKDLLENIDIDQKAINEIEKKIKIDAAILQIKNSLSSTKSQLEEKQKKIFANQKDIEGFVEKAKQSRMHEKVVLFSGQLTIHEKSLENHGKTKTEIEKRSEELKLAHTNFEKAIHDLADLTHKSVSKVDFKAILDDYESKVVAIDYELLNLKNKGAEERKKINLQLLDSKLPLNSKIPAQEAVVVLSKRAEELKLQLSNLGFTEMTSISDVKKQIKENQEKITTLKNCYQLREKLDDNQLNKEKLVQKLKEYTASLEKCIPLLSANQSLIKSLNNESNLLKEKKQDALKIAKLVDFRNDLIDGEPCPLCGAIDHPYTEHLPEKNESEIEKAISINVKELIAGEKIARLLENEISTSKASQKINTENLQELEKHIFETEIKLSTYAKQYPSLKINHLDALDAEIREYEKNVVSKERGMEAIEQLKILRPLKQDFQGLVEIGGLYSQVLGKRNALFGGKDIRVITNSLQEAFNQNRSLITKLEEFIDDREKQINILEKELREIERDLIPELDNFGVEDISSLKSLLLPQSLYEKYKKEEVEIQDHRKKLLAEQKHLLNEQDLLLSKDRLKEKKAEDLEEEILLNEQQRDKLNASLGALKSMLKEDELRRQKQSERQKIIEALEKENEKWSLLNHLIGSASGDSFSNFAQGLTLQNLLAFTNRRLQKLTDRYVLDKPGPDGTLNVIDQYQGNTERAVTTLSGGEIFILSLALALSLSDMASRNVTLESLFIDEGFGTLDQETLDIAMTTLEKLQSESKKMVGIISHVDALKERINVQIQLKKNAQGYSRIEIVS